VALAVRTRPRGGTCPDRPRRSARLALDIERADDDAAGRMEIRLARRGRPPRQADAALGPRLDEPQQFDPFVANLGADATAGIKVTPWQ